MEASPVLLLEQSLEVLGDHGMQTLYSLSSVSSLNPEVFLGSILQLEYLDTGNRTLSFQQSL